MTKGPQLPSPTGQTWVNHSPKVSPIYSAVKKSPIDKNYLTYDMIQTET